MCAQDRKRAHMLRFGKIIWDPGKCESAGAGPTNVKT